MAKCQNNSVYINKPNGGRDNFKLWPNAKLLRPVMTHMAPRAEDCGSECAARGGWDGKKKHLVVLRLLLCRVLSGYKTFTAHQLPGTQSRKMTKPWADVSSQCSCPPKRKRESCQRSFYGAAIIVLGQTATLRSRLRFFFFCRFFRRQAGLAAAWIWIWLRFSHRPSASSARSSL